MAKKQEKKTFRFSAKHLHPSSAAAEDVYSLQALLGRYGYLHGGYRPGHYGEATCRAVSQFQSFYGLYPDEDGVCDEATVELLHQPRCGVADDPAGTRDNQGRLASFVTAGAQWPRTDLSFRYLNYTPDLTESQQREIIQKAFDRWAAESALGFREVPIGDSSDLSVSFHRGSHGDGSPFDNGGGPDGNTLAHAFFPPPRGGSWAGSLHFDEFERWKDQPGGRGIRLYNVALHEIGHLLGLSHSQDQNAIMYALYDEGRNNLRADDIAGIQSLYGSPVSEPVAIAPGERVSGHLPGTDAEVRYQVTLQNKLLVRLEGPADEDFDLYVRYGAPVGTAEGEYDAVSYGVTADELLTIDDPKAGTYNLLVHSYRGLGSYTLEVEVV